MVQTTIMDEEYVFASETRKHSELEESDYCCENLWTS
jgi:hypothetical protein